MVRQHPEDLQHALGATIRRRRKALGLSQEALADAVCIHRTYIGSVERGERNVSVQNLALIAAALGWRLSELITNAEDAP